MPGYISRLTHKQVFFKYEDCKTTEIISNGNCIYGKPNFDRSNETIFSDFMISNIVEGLMPKENSEIL